MIERRMTGPRCRPDCFGHSTQYHNGYEVGYADGGIGLREAARGALEAWDRVTAIEYRDIAKGTLADPMIALRAALDAKETA